MEAHFKIFNKLSPAAKILLSFVLVAILGSLILALPILQKPGVEHSYLNHLLTSISLICVSGIASVPIYETYNTFGQIVVLTIIQIGGLGVITVLNSSLFFLQQSLPLREQYTLQMSINRQTNDNLRQFLTSIYKLTLFIEFIGALVIMIDFIPRFGLSQGSFNAVFLAVSAFCNSGFDNFSTQSLQDFSGNYLVTLTVSVLVIAGGLGFSVWFELIDRFTHLIKDKPRSFKVSFYNTTYNTRLILWMTVILLVTGTFVIWIAESQNSATLADLPLSQQFLNSFFFSVNSRTAGYTTIQYEHTLPITRFIFMLFTIVGGAPGGTAGGIKVTTFAILLLLIRAELNSYSKVVFRKRVIPTRVVRQAVLIVLFFILFLIVGYGLLIMTHPYLNALDLMFESVSAVGSSGISIILTDRLSYFGRIVLVLMMFAGRIGPSTMLVAILQRKNKDISYIDTNIQLG
ncbi:TrkH family potassium uptake protein [Fundicoccus sp. Sow4_H7]|uniref:TrkH family potassium uptake protein n=1 Tax=Fundicoccus sp. Sow4_H7 TaxID=3438784 RepID=UPI003F91AD9A